MYEIPAILKRIVVYRDEDFEKVLESERVIPHIKNSNADAKTIVVAEEFNEGMCPVCKCPTIANVLNSQNQFINECVGCKLQFTVII